MSTRSGKRIHSSFHENTIKADMETAVKSERKTRSRRMKEDVDELSVSLFQAKKRNNYVSYPTDDEQNAEEASDQDKDARRGRVLRRNTLKEQNIVVQNIDNIETLTEPENLIRKTRRGKKNVEKQTENLENVQVHVTEKPKSKKNKKKPEVIMLDQGTAPMPNKKSNRKKKKSKQSNSMVVEEVKQDGNLKNNMSINKSMSMESFHSAAGSPVNMCDDEEPALLWFAEETILDTNIMNTTLSKRKSSIKNITDTHEAMTTDADTTLQAMNDRKSIQKDITFEKRGNSIVNTTNIFETDGDTISMTPNNCSTKSNINNGTFDTTFEKNIKTDEKDFTRDMMSNKIVDTTFEKDTDCNVTPKKKISSIKDITYDKNEKVDDTTFEKDPQPTPQTSARKSLRKSNIKDTYLDKNNKIEDTTFEKETVSTPPRSGKKSLKRKSSIKDTTFDRNEKIDNTTFEKDTILTPQRSAKKSLSRQSIGTNVTFHTNENVDDTTFEKDTSSSPQNSAKKSLKDSNTEDTDNVESSAKKSRKSMKDTTFENCNISEDNEVPISAKKRKSNRFDTYINEEVTEKNNTTFDKDFNTESEDEMKRKSLQNDLKLSINDQSKKLNSTYQRNSKSSLISTDSEMEKSNISCISITSDESENLANTTPVLIESSMDNSCLSKEDSPAPQTPLKREGTFTKDGPELLQGTPPKEEALPLAGFTPYHVTKSSQKRVLNVTRSIEKNRLSAEPAPRMTRVMFCSPVDNPAAAAHETRKIIKSNLKGSNKSFVFDDSVSGASARAAPRKRSYTQSDAEDARAKRTRLAPDIQHSVDRLSRPRTSSAAAKLSDPTTPSKKPATPSKSKSDAKTARTKLPNFAALHSRQFSKMESLGECQERKAKRARQLLTPNGAVNMLERISPKDTATEPQKSKEQTKKTDTPTKLPTLESLRPGFTRFGFKLNLDVNPFSVPSKHTKPKPPAQQPLPSLAGATSVRREVAKQAVMREKSFTDRRNVVKRNENRTIIKGVRTNRRFELQMKLRNVE